MTDEQGRRRHAADLAITRAANALRPWMEERLVVWPPDRDGQVAPHDPLYLVRILVDRWFIEFARDLGPDAHQSVHDLRTFRNQWAHHVPLDEATMVRGLTACRRLIEAVGHRGAGVPSFRDHPEWSGVPPMVLSSSSQPAHRRMKDPRFRARQWERRFAPHVEPINNLVDDLIEDNADRWMPYTPPYHGGSRAEVLWLFQDPGKMTSTDFGGSGFLGCENDDASAETAARCLDAAGVAMDRIIPWNAYPWFLPEQGPVSAVMLNEGVEALVRLLGFLPEVHTVVTGGRKAHDSWSRLARRHVDIAARYRAIESLHTSGRGITRGSRQPKADGVANVVRDLRRAVDRNPTA